MDTIEAKAQMLTVLRQLDVVERKIIADELTRLVNCEIEIEAYKAAVTQRVQAYREKRNGSTG